MSITQQQIESDTTKWLTATHIHSYWKSRIIATYHVSRLPKSLIKIHIVVDFPYAALLLGGIHPRVLKMKKGPIPCRNNCPRQPKADTYVVFIYSR